MSQPYGILLFMLIEAAHRVEAAAKNMLALAKDGSASCDELREMLASSRRAAAALSAAQTSAAATISGRERHGDRGAQVLADTAGLTRRDAHSQITTAETLRAAPAARDAVESGRVPPANARRLAEAISKTGAHTVEADPRLLAKAETMRPDQFMREARRWTAQRQSDGGEADYRRMRARRSVRFFDGEDGMVHLYGEFDPVTGKRIANRLHHHARKLHSADQHSVAKAERRRFPQCLADALDDLTATGTTASNTTTNATHSTTNATNTTHSTDDRPGTGTGAGNATHRAPTAGTGNTACSGVPGNATHRAATANPSESGCCGAPDKSTSTAASGRASDDSTDPADTGTGNASHRAETADPSESGCCGAPDGGADAGDAAGRGSGRPFADICVVAHVDEGTGRLIGELPDGTRIPSSVLDELTCNATITGVIFDRPGRPIWQTTAGRDATATQRRILRARWGGCFHCGANFAICAPHHIDPVSQGGQTHIDNLVPACWECHQLIHRDGWQIHKSPDGNHTLHPPQRIHHGPAHAPEQPPPTVTDPRLFARPREPESRHDMPTLFTDPQPPTPTAGTETARAGPGSPAPKRRVQCSDQMNRHPHLGTAPGALPPALRSNDPQPTPGPGTDTARAGPGPPAPNSYTPRPGRHGPVADTTEAARDGTGPEPAPTRQAIRPRRGPATARAERQAARAGKAARAGPG